MAQASKSSSKSSGKSAKAKAEKAVATAGQGAETSPFVELRQRMDQLFDDFMQGWPAGGLAGPHMFDVDRLMDPFGLSRGNSDMIRVHFDMTETDSSVEITAELPGMDEKDIDVTLADGILTIKGEKKAESEKKKKDVHLSERHYGSFARSFRLPDAVDEDKVKARFDKGVLSISLPKRAEAKKRQKKIAITKH